MDLAWEVLRSNRKAVSTKTKIWNSTKPGRDRTNSIKWPQIWNCSEPRLYPDLRKRLFSLQFHCCIPWPPPFPQVFLHFCYMKYVFPTIISFQNHLGSTALWSGQESSVSWEWWKPSQPGFNHFFWSQESPESWYFISCRKQSCFEAFMRLREKIHPMECIVCLGRGL